jgi:ABC-type sugar transport system ATPase subunit
MAGIQLRSVEKRYGETWVLRGIDVSIADGEYVVLVGPSGCGKSTLLRSIAGLNDITGGAIHIGARDVTRVSPRDRNVAMVFQSYALYPHMTVRENLAFPLKIRKDPPAAIQAAVAEVAGMLELGALLDRLPGQLSGGQRQRVAMGRAIVRRPDVFLFDEPLSNLDAALRHHMRVELKRLHRRLGATVVHVTHDQVEALTLADRILVLHQGVVQQVGPPRELFDAPANTFVATFLGSPAMNLLPGRVDDAGLSVGGVALGWVDGVGRAVRGDVTVGLRPTDVVAAAASSSEGASPWTGVVDVTESLGAEALLHVEIGPHKLVVQVAEPNPWRAGAQVRVVPRRAHVFDPGSGRRL